ncbi:hypothetical protein, partial [Craurococcus roseus]|uniref:hypothetical protein n=1 Tax=Craurococcus roseus TaxID=77585 RepID=UPI0038D104A7
MQDDKGLKLWGGLSAALHAAVLLVVLLGLVDRRRVPEPTEEAIAVELVTEAPPQMAQAERPAPAPSPEPTPQPPRPEPTPAPPEPPRPAPPS